jgi:hypothetical protein
MATVRRSKNGEITHVLVGNSFYKKKDAEKILHDNISIEDLNKYLRLKYPDKSESYRSAKAKGIVLELLNADLSVERVKTKILYAVEKISEPD